MQLRPLSKAYKRQCRDELIAVSKVKRTSGITGTELEDEGEGEEQLEEIPEVMRSIEGVCLS